MPSYFQNPENALKRANEFIRVGNKVSAVEVLNDVIRSRKHRNKWTKTHQSIMLLFTKLCIELQRSSYAKDGLYQYRNICKDSAPSSFEIVVKTFLLEATKMAESARHESEQHALQMVEDLDQVVTPESLLLSTVSSEGEKERTDRVLLTPWVKFLWESYRNVLELLKNNNSVLTVYADVAKDAFKFCLRYQRKTEFRKLCDILRNHLLQAQKYQNQPHSLKFDQPETIQCLVGVRFEQLESSINVDLWQEAFKAIEEIHNLLGISGKAPKPEVLEDFYVKQAKVYWMANNKLFHAAALHKLFILRKERKKTFSQEEAQTTASQVLLSTLSVQIKPVPCERDRFLEVDDASRDKACRLAALLRMPVPPTRATLIKDMLRYNVLQYVPKEVEELYNYLQVEFNPLLLCKRVVPILESLDGNDSLSQYVAALKEVTLVRLIKQVTQVYETIELSHLVELAYFTTPTHLEKVVVQTAKSNGIQVRIDHQTKSLHFGTDMTFSYKDETAEGPYIQPMPSEMLCNQLILMSQALQQAVRIVSVKELQTEREANSRKSLLDYQQHMRGDHRQALSRKQLIEARKEFIENLAKAKEEKEESQRRHKEKLERKAEQERLNREAKEREEEKKKKELQEIKLKKAQDRLEAMKKTPVGARALAKVTVEDLVDMNPDDIFSKQLKQMEKEKKEKDSRLKSQEKKVDYFERAKRLQEIPLLKSQYEEQRETDRQFHNQQEEERIQKAILEREEAEENSARLSVMREDEKVFREKLFQGRKAKLQEQLVEFEEKLKVVKAERLALRKQQRKEKRKAEAAAAKKAEEERLIRDRQDEEKRKLEEEQKERNAKMEEMRLKQEQRQREAEEKMERMQREEMQQINEMKARPPPEPDNWRQRAQEPEEEDRYPPQDRDGDRRRDDRRPRERGDDSSWRRDDGYRDSRGPPRGRDYRDGPPQSRGRDYDQYDSPRGSRRGPPRDYDDRGSPRDRDDRGPPRDRDRDESGPPRDRDRDERGPPREHDHAERGPPRDHDRDERGPPRERDRDERGPPRDRDDRGPPRDHGDDWRRRPDQRERDDTRGERRGAYRPPGARDRGDGESSWRRDDGYRDSRGPPRGRDYRDGPPSRGRDYDQYDSPRGGRRGPPRDYGDRGPPRDRDRDREDRRDRYERGPPRDRGDDWRRHTDDGDRDRDHGSWRSGRGGDDGGRRWDRDRDASPRGKVDKEGFVEVISRRR